MSRKPLPDSDFSRLIADLRAETDESERKLAKLYYSRGNFSGPQAAALVGTFKTAPEKMRVLRMLERRLCRMSCAEGEEVLRNLQLTQGDKLSALDYIKRTLFDHQTVEGTEHIMKAFISEKDKLRALNQLCAISSYANEEVPAGGHAVPESIGAVLSSAPPLEEHAYGPVRIQLYEKYGRIGLQNFPPTLRAIPNSAYACHPSYIYGRQLDTSFNPSGGRPPLPPRPIDTAVTGPARKLYLPPLPSSTIDRVCFSHGDPCLGAEQSGVSSIGFIDHQKWTNSKCR
ncbi:hypothetical protein ECG_06240 [Echinococcus granulosus]|uniref:DUF4476 domain-containing protein n=1 Tax=Echinococcus granulosus TaxID=6210 RepID=A0A068WHT9_ECHGR|nr:hypothetical protein ECG_06240 [Echinococcus granulosus]CDS19672.1 hypothetical protein EgrG_000500100 [Echinococcus granulosus]